MHFTIDIILNACTWSDDSFVYLISAWEGTI